LKDDIRLNSSDKDNWLKNHTLSKEQVRILMQNKYERAKKDQQKLASLKTLVNYTD
jgi:hypothetical protein